MWWLTLADGPLPIGDAIYGIGVTIDLIGLGYISHNYSQQSLKEDVKIASKEMSVSKEQTQKSSAIRFQLQTGSETPASTVRVSNDKLEVKKRDAMELYQSFIQMQLQNNLV